MKYSFIIISNIPGTYIPEDSVSSILRRAISPLSGR